MLMDIFIKSFMLQELTFTGEVFEVKVWDMF